MSHGVSFLFQKKTTAAKEGKAGTSASPSLACDGYLLTPKGLIPVAPQHIPNQNSLVELMFGASNIKEAATPRQFINNIEFQSIGGLSDQGLSFREQAMQDRGYLVVRDESDVYNPCDLIDIEAETAFNVACSSTPEDKARREAELMFSYMNIEASDEQEMIDSCLDQLDALDAFDNSDIDVVWQRRPHRGNIGIFGMDSVYYGDEQGVRYGS